MSPSDATFAEALAAAVAGRNVSLVWLHRRLSDRGNPVSVATLSYWRSGQRRPEGAASYAAIETIEELLGLEHRALVDRIGPARRVGPYSMAVEPSHDDVIATAWQEVTDRLGVTDDVHNSRAVSIRTTLDVGSEGQPLRQSDQVLIQALTDGVREGIHIVALDHPTDVAPEFTALGGGQIVRRYEHPLRRVFGVAVALDRILTIGDEAMFEVAVDYPSGSPVETSIGNFVRHQVREMSVWVRFHPTFLPAWCEEFTITNDVEESTPRELDGATTAHVVRRRFGPGALGLRWQF